MPKNKTIKAIACVYKDINGKLKIYSEGGHYKIYIHKDYAPKAEKIAKVEIKLQGEILGLIG